MGFITVEAYKNAQVHTITIENKELFWVRMIDIQNGLGIKNIFDLVRKEIQGIYEIQKPAKKQIKKYKRSEAETDKEDVYPSNVLKYARHDIIEKIIKNCKGVKRCNDGINKMHREKNREDFRII